MIKKVPRQTSPKARLILTLFSVLAYTLLFLFLFYYTGNGMCGPISAVIPVIAVAWLYGFRPGVYAGMLSLPSNVIMFAFFGLNWWERLIMNGTGIVGSVALIIVGAIVGRISDLSIQLRKQRDQLNSQTKELRAAVEESRKTKEQLENLMATSLDPIIIGDRTARITKPNKAFLKMLGYSEDEVIGKHPLELSVVEKGTYESITGELIDIGEDFFKAPGFALYPCLRACAKIT